MNGKYPLYFDNETKKTPTLALRANKMLLKKMERFLCSACASRIDTRFKLSLTINLYLSFWV